MQLNEEKELTIEEFFELASEGGIYQIESPSGWSEIKSLVRKNKKECYNLFLEIDELGCSADHMVLTQDGWKKAEDLNVEKDLIITKYGKQKIIAKEWIGDRDTFDMELNSSNHSYYSNNIISHNTGKSMTAEVAAKVFNVPLLKLNMGAVFGAKVGESEDRIRKTIILAESISPCVLFIDEVEKGIGGVKSSSSTDGGTTSRVVAQILTWMQEKTSSVFVACTANNVSDIPPEFMRAGRFDEIFFVDLPDQKGRMDVFQKILTRKHKKTDKFENIKIDEIDLVKASVSTENYTPAEIEKSIDNALFVAYSDNKRKITTEDIISEAKKFSPLFDSRRDDIKEMRKWAIGENGKGAKARLANGTKKVESTFTEKQPDRALSLESIDGIV